jgi:hypothetical protein
LFLVALTRLALADDPAVHAEKIARAQPRVRRNWEELRRQANRVSDPALRKLLVGILDRPELRVVAARRAQEKAIAGRLAALGLWDEKNGPLFPTGSAMAFVAAAGSPWHGHHAYPGGLVYHTLFNLRSGLSYAANYLAVYGVRANLDWIRAAAIWHDSAKPLVLPWNPDGSLPPSEPLLAGTPAHHIWGLAEALYRKLDPRLIVAIASAHTAPAPEADRAQVAGYLRAAAILAGTAFPEAGLNADGQDLAGPPPIEAFITHFDDGDFPFTIYSCQAAAKKAEPAPGGDYWARDARLAADGDIALYGK